WIEARLDERVFHERLVGQRLEGGAGFRYEDEEGVGHIDAVQHVHRVVGIDVADEAGFHFQGAFGTGPVLQRQIYGTRSQIASADADLHDGRESFAGGVGYFATVDLAREVGDPFLLL